MAVEAEKLAERLRDLIASQPVERDVELARLREALARHGAHDGTCAAVIPIEGLGCTCGYAAALSGESEERT